MDGSARQPFVVKEIIKIICCFLAIDENDHARWRHGQEEIEKALALLCLIHEDDLRCKDQYRVRNLAKLILPFE